MVTITNSSAIDYEIFLLNGKELSPPLDIMNATKPFPLEDQICHFLIAFEDTYLENIILETFRVPHIEMKIQYYNYVDKYVQHTWHMEPIELRTKK
jgi:hypothetical protein